MQETQKMAKDMPHIVITGNLVDWFTFTGPFPTGLDAVQWAEQSEWSEWRVALLVTPTQRDPLGF
jgi:hypothetical protein